MKVIIVGGVAGGASTAARLRRLDEKADITVYERGEQVSYANCGLPYHIGGVIPKRESLLVQTPGKLRLILNINVKILSEVTDINTQEKTVTIKDLKTGEEFQQSWDKLVLSPGGSPIRPPVPGDDHAKIFTLQTVSNMDNIKRIVDNRAKNALVLGGGFIGVEIAENLRERGLLVHLVERGEQILPFLDKEMTNDLEGHMTRNGVRLYMANSIKAYHDNKGKINCELQNGENITVDFVVNAVGVKPNITLAQKAGLEIGKLGGIKVDQFMRTSNPDIYAAGDAVEVKDLITGQATLLPLAGPASRQGRCIANHICGQETSFNAVQGSSVLKVFDMTAAATGANEKRLKAADIAYEKIYIHPAGHANYYPGTSAMQFKLLFSADDGKVLGAQIIGFDGVDKRIDVLAVAIRAGLTVYDLEELELAYAPPYGSAKDPVNMAGFVASNLLKGDAPQWYAEDFASFASDDVVIDVRNECEYERWHIPESINIPLSCLRGELEDIPGDKKLYIYCRTGFRSYLALRILKQSGFNQVYTLSGGALTFNTLTREIHTGKRLVPEIAYGEQCITEFIQATGKVIEVDATHVGFASPLQLLQQNLDMMSVGDDVLLSITDQAFTSYLPSWCNTYGHILIDIKHQGELSRVKIRKGVEI